MILNAAHAISDSIADEISTKIFDPSFTTNEVGKWSGQDKDQD